MIRIEGAPFSGKMDRLGKKATSDSVVMLYHNKPPSGDTVIKWNRSLINSSKEAIGIATFLKKSLKLYQTILGEKYIVPTELVVGEKIDEYKKRIKVYEVQPYIESWDGHSLPNDLRNDNGIISSWNDLAQRLTILYVTGYYVNKRMLRQGKDKFPINITVGKTRETVIRNKPNLNVSMEIPHTSNILIDKTNRNLHLCDFGEYTPWDPGMEDAYTEILNRSLLEITQMNNRKHVLQTDPHLIK